MTHTTLTNVERDFRIPHAPLRLKMGSPNAVRSGSGVQKQ